jgi:hypothetical protein
MIIPLTLMTISNLFPFLRQLNYYYTHIQSKDGGPSSSYDNLTVPLRSKSSKMTFIPWREVVVYMCFNAIIYLSYGIHISRGILSYIFSFFKNSYIGGGRSEAEGDLMMKPVNWWQSFFFTAALFGFYVSFILFVFQKKQKVIRRYKSFFHFLS